MLKLSGFKKLLVASVVTSALVTSVSAKKAEQKYVIATASTGGTYYPVGWLLRPL